jgi:hypothetical protein
VRLEIVERGATLKSRLFFKMIRVLSGQRAPDVVRTLSHRRHVFGGEFSGMVHATLRGPSAWKVGERELFASFVSSVNQCEF